MPEEPGARAAAGERLRAALTLAIPTPTQRCRPTGCGRPPQCQTASSPGHAARIHCRDAHRQKWLTPIHRAVAAVIADVRHIQNTARPLLHVPKLRAGAGSAASGKPGVKP